MIRLMTDFNARDGDGAAALPSDAPAEVLVPGTRIILFEPHDFECEAIVRRGEFREWVADIVEGTIKSLPAPPEPLDPGDPAYARPMTMIPVDFCKLDDNGSIVLPENTPAEALVPGRRVIIYHAGQWISEAEVWRGRGCAWAAATVFHRQIPWVDGHPAPPSGRAYLERVGFSKERIEQIYGKRDTQ